MLIRHIKAQNIMQDNPHPKRKPFRMLSSGRSICSHAIRALNEHQYLNTVVSHSAVSAVFPLGYISCDNKKFTAVIVSLFKSHCACLINVLHLLLPAFCTQKFPMCVYSLRHIYKMDSTLFRTFNRQNPQLLDQPAHFADHIKVTGFIHAQL